MAERFKPMPDQESDYSAQLASPLEASPGVPKSKQGVQRAALAGLVTAAGIAGSLTHTNRAEGQSAGSRPQESTLPTTHHAVHLDHPVVSGDPEATTLAKALAHKEHNKGVAQVLEVTDPAAGTHAAEAIVATGGHAYDVAILRSGKAAVEHDALKLKRTKTGSSASLGKTIKVSSPGSGGGADMQVQFGAVSATTNGADKNPKHAIAKLFAGALALIGREASTPPPTPTPTPEPTSTTPTATPAPTATELIGHTPDSLKACFNEKLNWPQEDLAQTLNDWTSGKIHVPENRRIIFSDGTTRPLGTYDNTYPDKSKYLGGTVNGLLLGKEVVDNHMIIYVGFEDKACNQYFLPFNVGDLGSPFPNYYVPMYGRVKEMSDSGEGAIKQIRPQDYSAFLDQLVQEQTTVAFELFESHAGVKIDPNNVKLTYELGLDEPQYEIASKTYDMIWHATYDEPITKVQPVPLLDKTISHFSSTDIPHADELYYWNTTLGN